MPFSIAHVVRALQEADLLLDSSPRLPELASDITEDSRAVVQGGLFVAIQGCQKDGHEYLEAAVRAGAAAAIVEQAGYTGLPTLLVRDGRRAAGLAAAAAFGEPARRLGLVGVTGTNGKTTCVEILRHLLDEAASVGTLGVLLGSPAERLPGGGGLTTPGPIELQRLLRQLVDRGVTRVAMEVSSHSLDQRRVEGLRYQVGVFTNFTRDHLDYHGSEAAYFAAKARLLDYLTPGGWALVNRDDPAWAALPRGVNHRSFGVEQAADFQALEVTYTSRGCSFNLAWEGRSYPVRVPLMGSFNVSNAMAAASAACLMGVTPERVRERLATLPQVPGRLEILSSSPTVVRDYAHTPDALARALAAVRPFTPGRLILVFGCGGDRDRGKRPLMARAAHAGADQLILTSDNPRSEDPERILDQVQAGLPPGTPFDRIEDRRTAIAHALHLAEPGDVVLLAGKGHETYQIRGTETLAFDEQEIVAELLKVRSTD